MQALTELQNINIGVLLASICVVMLAIKYVVELFEWFVKKLGLETKAMRIKREEHDLLIATAEGLKELKAKEKKDVSDFRGDRIRDRQQSFDIQKELTDAISSISDKLDDMKKEMFDKNIADKRWTIISTANKIADGKNINREAYRFALKTYDDYEQLIEKYGIQNGEIEVSIKVIKDSYEEKLKNGF